MAKSSMLAVQFITKPGKNLINILYFRNYRNWTNISVLLLKFRIMEFWNIIGYIDNLISQWKVVPWTSISTTLRTQLNKSHWHVRLPITFILEDEQNLCKMAPRAPDSDRYIKGQRDFVFYTASLNLDRLGTSRRKTTYSPNRMILWKISYQ